LSQAVNCTLCIRRALFFYCFREKNYYNSTGCNSILLSPADYLAPDDEKKRYDNYDKHNNNVNDPGYRQFLKPLADKVLQKYGFTKLTIDNRVIHFEL